MVHSGACIIINHFIIFIWLLLQPCVTYLYFEFLLYWMPEVLGLSDIPFIIETPVSLFHVVTTTSTVI